MKMRRATTISRLFRSVSWVVLLAAGTQISATGEEAYPANMGTFRVGIQTYTFRGHTFEEAVQKTAQLGLAYVEGYPGQAVSRSLPGQSVDPAASPEVVAKMKQILQAHRVHLHNFGVVHLPHDESTCRQVFDFAREMGVRTLVAEPPQEAWPLIERLVKEYDIQVAVHNHPAPSHYSDPRVVAAAVQSQDHRIGAAPDTGHWMRSGFDPVESLKLLNGRVLSMHLKDIKEMNVREARDWPFGQGTANIRAVLDELERQRFTGLVAIEYEASQPDPTQDVAECVAFLRSILEAK